MELSDKYIFFVTVEYFPDFPEASAGVIHRALEKKRQDDGHVMCIVVHKADRLKTDLRINHPLVRVHVLDVNTGEYVKKCSRYVCCV